MTSAVAMLRRGNTGYPKTIRILEECGGEDGINCVSCEYGGDCNWMFDEQVRLRDTCSWKLESRGSDHADAKGSGKPDTTGSWIPTLSIKGYKDTIFRG